MCKFAFLFAGISILVWIGYHWYLYMSVYDLKEFQKMATDYAGSLTPLPSRATVVGLYGDLGAGKTTFTQAVGKALGVTEQITSPTFLIMKRFTIYDLRFKNLIHIDAYRLKSSEELRKLRFEELLADPQNLILVEWADKAADLLPKDHLKLHFEFVDDQTRKISRS